MSIVTLMENGIVAKISPTVTLSVYHPVLQKQVPHFIMEC